MGQEAGVEATLHCPARRMRAEAVQEHPAKFSDPILELLAELLPPLAAGRPVLDPMGGVGRLAELGLPLLLSELQYRWAAACPDPVMCADAGRLPVRTGSVRVVATSPTYGSRMADTYAGDAKGSKRYTYRIYHGAPLHPENTGGMQWGRKYREKNAVIIREIHRVLEPDGHLVLNVSDHIRQWKHQPVARWWGKECVAAGFIAERGFRVNTRRMKNGENAEARVPYEIVYVMRKAA